MKRHNKYRILASFVLIFAIFVFTEIKAESFQNGTDRIIEVCSNGVVYVPPGTKYVKCMGKIKKVIKVEPYDPDQQKDEGCLCWNCCGGFCGVVVACDWKPQDFSDSDDAEGSLCVFWLDCD